MMMIPRKNDFDFIDEVFNDPFFTGNYHTKKERKLMKTDIKEMENEYVLEIDVPGYDKDNIKVSLEKGYLTVTATKEQKVDEEKEKYIHKERFYGECSRSFYLGDGLKEEDIKASFKNGTLKLSIPKASEKLDEGKKYIEIED